MLFTHPEPSPASTRVCPVFLPFAGCPYRCAFCAQDKQTGRDDADLGHILEALESDLDRALAHGSGPYEIAFYGGTFTALPAPWPETFLGLAVRYRERGLITRVRCSTRPDCVDETILADLRSQGLDMVELGVQSFDDHALQVSGRGYAGDVARAACALVQQSDLALGIQLLPGLPGDRPGVFAQDVRTAAALRPEIVRLYPCLVIKDTPLAKMWERGDFEPWPLERAKRELAQALPVFWEQNVRVIRLGLAPEGTLNDSVLAGPWHPALGQSVRGMALLEIVRDKVRESGRKPSLLEVPRRYSGEIYGHGKELASAYFEIGLPEEAVKFVEGERFRIE